MNDPDPQTFLPLTPAAFHILLVLAGEDCHGYRIMQEVTANSGGTLKLGPGTLYRSIKHLLTAGLIVETEQRPDPQLDDERRRYYRISPLGKSVVQLELAQLEHVMSLARAKNLLKPAYGGTA